MGVRLTACAATSLTGTPGYRMLWPLGGGSAEGHGGAAMSNDTRAGGNAAWPPQAEPAPPLYPAPGAQAPSYGPGQPYPPAADPPGLPSRAMTIVITFFFGLFGLIPAYLHSREAERRGASGSRYWVAFGVSFAVSTLAYIGLIVAAFALFVGATSSVVGEESVAQAPLPAPEAPLPGPAVPPPVPGGSSQSGSTWTAATIMPLLDEFADDEAEDWATFSADSVVTIPCGGEGAHGAAPATIERTSGGAQYGASAQILTDAGSANRELERLRSLVADCGAHDYISKSTGTVLLRCEQPVLESLAPVLRYQQVCENDPVAYAFAIVQAGNAVVGLSAPTTEELDAALPGLLNALQVD